MAASWTSRCETQYIYMIIYVYIDINIYTYNIFYRKEMSNHNSIAMYTMTTHVSQQCLHIFTHNYITQYIKLYSHKTHHIYNMFVLVVVVVVAATLFLTDDKPFVQQLCCVGRQTSWNKSV